MSGDESKPMITRIGAYGVIEDHGHILLCRLSELVSKHQGWWTLPGGGIDFGEHPEQGMIREVEEETGLLVRATSLLGINAFTIEGDAEQFHSIQIVYGTEVIGGTLRYELNGTTDMCQWHEQGALKDLPVVELVNKAVDFKSGIAI